MRSEAVLAGTGCAAKHGSWLTCTATFDVVDASGRDVDRLLLLVRRLGDPDVRRARDLPVS